MISLRNRDDAVATILTACSLLILAGSLVFMVFGPKPTTAGMASKFKKDSIKILIATKDARERLEQIQGAVKNRTWSGPTQDVAPAALARVNELARRHNLTGIQFRPQRTVEGTISQLPYLINVQGSFLNVMAFERDIEAPETRVAVNLVQLTSSDAASDQVTASISVVAYLTPGTSTAPLPLKDATNVNKA